MMTVLEYAQDMNKTVDEVIKKCKEFGISANNEDDLLDDEAITELDACFQNDDIEELEDRAEEMAEQTKINVDNVVKKEKVKKQKEIPNKKDFLNKKKEMYKNKNKLMTNKDAGEKVVLYKENMTINELANAIGVSGAELVKKLFNLGMMATLNNSISFENAEILVLEYKKELKRAEAQDVSNFEEYEIVDSEEDMVKRAPVIVGSGSNNTSIAVKKSVIAQELGADGLLVVTPYYNKCTDDGLYLHYKEINDNVNIPIILYNVPSRTCVNINIGIFTLDRKSVV